MVMRLYALFGPSKYPCSLLGLSGRSCLWARHFTPITQDDIPRTSVTLVKKVATNYYKGLRMTLDVHGAINSKEQTKTLNYKFELQFILSADSSWFKDYNSTVAGLF